MQPRLHGSRADPEHVCHLRRVQPFDVAKQQDVTVALGERVDPGPDLPDTFQGTVRLIDAHQGLVAFQDFSIVPGRTFIRIAVSIPSSLLLKDLRPAMRFFSLTLLISLCIVLVVSFYVSRYLSRPIVELASAAADLARWDRARLEHEHPHGPEWWRTRPHD